MSVFMQKLMSLTLKDVKVIAYCHSSVKNHFKVKGVTSIKVETRQIILASTDDAALERSGR